MAGLFSLWVNKCSESDHERTKITVAVFVACPYIYPIHSGFLNPKYGLGIGFDHFCMWLLSDVVVLSCLCPQAAVMILGT